MFSHTTTNSHYFHGKKEHSTTYAAASFFVPDAAAKVEAMRAQKRKLKHASPPPVPKVSSAVRVEEHRVEAIQEVHDHQTESEVQEQAESLVSDHPVSTNDHQLHESRAATVQGSLGSENIEAIIDDGGHDGREDGGPEDGDHDHNGNPTRCDQAELYGASVTKTFSAGQDSDRKDQDDDAAEYPDPTTNSKTAKLEETVEGGALHVDTADHNDSKGTTSPESSSSPSSPSMRASIKTRDLSWLKQTDFQ